MSEKDDKQLKYMEYFSRYRFCLIVLPLIIILFGIISTYFQSSIERRGLVGDQTYYFGLSQALVESEPTFFLENKRNPIEVREAMIKRGPAYPFYLALSQTIFQIDSAADIARYQIILNFFSIILLYLIIKTGLKSDKAATVGVLLYCCYFPFAYMQAYLFTENLCHTLILAITFFTQLLFRNLDRKIWPVVFLAIIALGLSGLYLTRAVYFYYALVFFVLIALLIILNRKIKAKKKTVLIGLFFAFISIPYGSWINAVNNHSSSDDITFSVNGPRTIDRTIDESYDLSRDGFPQVRSGINSKRLQAKDFKKSIADDPFKSILLRIDKVYRLWHSPATHYNAPILGSHTPINMFHIILIFGSVFLFISINGRLYKFIFALPIIYTTVVYGSYFSEEHRFVFPVMPIVILAFVFGGFEFIKKTAKENSSKLKKVIGLAILALVCASPLLIPPSLAGIHPTAAQYSIGIIAIAAIVFMLIYISARHAKTKSVRAYYLISGLMILSVIVTHQLNYSRWYIKNNNITAQTPKYVKTIEVDDNIKLGAVHKIYVSIDALTTDEAFDLSKLNVKLNGKRITKNITIKRQGKKMALAVMQNSHSTIISDRAALAPEFKNWLIYAVDKNVINRKTNTIEVDFSNMGEQHLAIFSSSLSSNQLHCGPNTPIAHKLTAKQMNRDIGRTSLWKFQSDGDIRLYSCQKKTGRSEESYPLNVVLQIFYKNGVELIL